MNRKKEVIFEGKKFILGLHGVPEYYKNSEYNKDEDWYWKEGTKKEDNSFLPAWNIPSLQANK